MSSHRDDVLVGAIEAGGTKFVCAVGSGPSQRILARIEFPTGREPSRLLETVIDWLKEREAEHGLLRAIGIASFGPVDLNLRSPTYGFITSTTKPGWQNTDIVSPIKRAFNDIPIGFDTDVNGAALGEFLWGAAAGIEDFIYITIGTGIGASAMIRGRLLHGLGHPEMGHILLPNVPGDDFGGICPFHGRCWEGLCSGPAMARRTGLSAENLPADHPTWMTEIQYIALAITNLICVLSPRRIIVGGSVRKAGQLGEDRFFELLRARVHETLNGYLGSSALDHAGILGYIVPPALGDDAGIAGAIALGQRAIEEAPTSPAWRAGP